MNNIFQIRLDSCAFFCFIYYFCIYPLYAFLVRNGDVISLPTTLILYIFPVVILSVVSLRFLSKNKQNVAGILMLFLFVFVYITLVVLFNGSFWKIQVTIQNLVQICYMMFAFVVGLFLKDIDRFKRIILWLYWGVSLFWLLHVDVSIFRVDLSHFKSIEDTAIYLAMGEGYAVLSMLTLYVCRKEKWLPALITIVSIPILFFINSRASLFLYIMVLFFPFVSLGKYYRYVLVLLLITSLLSILLYVNIDLILDSRVMRLILHTAEDTSLQARNNYMEKELVYLWKNWFLGDYSNYLIREGPGGYIHNFLSFWAQYGFLPFLGMWVLFIWAGIFNIRQWMKQKSCYLFVIMLFVFSMTAFLFAKSYSYQLIWVALGITFREYKRYYSIK